MAKVTVGIRWAGPPTWGLFDSLLQLRPPGGAFRILRPPKPLDLCTGGNWIIQRFLATGDEWLLSVDADAVLHPQTVHRLLSWGGVPAVGALAVSKRVPRFPVVFRGRADQGPNYYYLKAHMLHQWVKGHPALISNDPVVLEPRPDDALYEVDFTGLHCLLLHRDALLALDEPWLQPAPGTEYGRPQEDRVFCERLRAAGFPVFVDRSVSSGHVAGDVSIGLLDFMAYYQISDWSKEHGPQE